jgi:hypothetical protein
MSTTTLLTIATFIIGILILIIECIKLRTIHILKIRFTDLVSTLYNLDRSQKNSNLNLLNIDIRTASLQESFNTLLTQFDEKAKQTHMPSPDEVTLIEKTITDLIETEVSLSNNLTVARKHALEEIAANVIRTYPDIDREYILRKTTAILQTFSEV